MVVVIYLGRFFEMLIKRNFKLLNCSILEGAKHRTMGSSRAECCNGGEIKLKSDYINISGNSLFSFVSSSFWSVRSTTRRQSGLNCHQFRRITPFVRKLSHKNTLIKNDVNNDEQRVK